jgi:hypothetical protein
MNSLLDIQWLPSLINPHADQIMPYPGQWHSTSAVMQMHSTFQPVMFGVSDILTLTSAHIEDCTTESNTRAAGKAPSAYRLHSGRSAFLENCRSKTTCTHQAVAATRVYFQTPHSLYSHVNSAAKPYSGLCGILAFAAT